MRFLCKGFYSTRDPEGSLTELSVKDLRGSLIRFSARDQATSWTEAGNH